MREKISIKFLPRDKQGSKYDWANINVGDTMVGKARCLINGNTITVFSINIFPEHQGRKYGEKTIEALKKSYDRIIADRVRPQATGFWSKMDFIDKKNGTFVYPG